MLVVNEPLIQTRVLAVREHGRNEVERGIIRLEVSDRGPSHVNPFLRHAVVDGNAPVLVERHLVALGTRKRWAGRKRREVFFDERFGRLAIEFARDGEHTVIRRVELLEKGVDVLERRARNVLHTPDDVPRIRMAFGKEVLEEHFDGSPIRNVVHALAPLVLDDVALVVEVLLRHRVEQIAHAVGLRPEHELERAGGNRLEIIRPIEIRRAVDTALRDIGAGALHERDVLAFHVARAFEHHVLEQMGETGLAGLLVLRAHVVPKIDVRDRELVVLVQDDLKAVRESVGLEIDAGNNTNFGASFLFLAQRNSFQCGEFFSKCGLSI